MIALLYKMPESEENHIDLLIFHAYTKYLSLTFLDPSCPSAMCNGQTYAGTNRSKPMWPLSVFELGGIKTTFRLYMFFKLVLHEFHTSFLLGWWVVGGDGVCK